MKKILLAILFISAFINSNGQSYLKFFDNNLLKDGQVFEPLFFNPLIKQKSDKVLQQAIALDIPKLYINGFCEARAEFLCKKLLPLAPEIGKIWAFAPAIYTLVSDKSLSHKNPLIVNETIKWNYHVAPVLAILNGNKIDTVVIDFSIKDKAFIPYREWLSQLNCKEAIYTFTDDFHYLFNTLDSLKLSGPKYNDFLMPKNFPKILSGQFWSLKKTDTTYVPSGLAYSELAINLINNHLKSPKYSGFSEQIKSVLTQEGLKGIISGNNDKLPPDLVLDCKNYYNSRFAYWMRICQEK